MNSRNMQNEFIFSAAWLLAHDVFKLYFSWTIFFIFFHQKSRFRLFTLRPRSFFRVHFQTRPPEKKKKRKHKNMFPQISACFRTFPYASACSCIFCIFLHASACFRMLPRASACFRMFLQSVARPGTVGVELLASQKTGFGGGSVRVLSEWAGIRQSPP